jgi:hypothetical protein
MKALLRLGLVVVLLAAAVAVAASVSRAVRPAAEPVSVSVATEPTATPTPTPTAAGTAGATPLSVAEALSWCRGEGCTADRFAAVVDDHGRVDPAQLFFAPSPGPPVSFLLPAGVSADVCACGYRTTVTGPVFVARVCWIRLFRS